MKKKAPSPSFLALDRNTDLHRHYLLEASAGTGKTFAIENILVRLIMGRPNDPVSPKINEILAVTFTRAAAAELKVRIRKCLETSLAVVKAIRKGTKVNDAPDYLLALRENDEVHTLNVKQRLERALACFEEAQIFTIHGFCYRMLADYGIEADQTIDALLGEKGATPLQVMRIIKDFFRTELKREKYSVSQLYKVLAEHNHDIHELTRSLYLLLKQGIPIATYPCFRESFDAFQTTMQKILQDLSPTPDSILNDFIRLAPLYQKTCDKAGRIHPVLLEQMRDFAQLWSRNSWTWDEFDQLLEEGMAPVAALNPSSIKARCKLLSSPFFEAVRQHLLPIIATACNPMITKIRMVKDCQELIRRIGLEEELFISNDLLTKMREASLCSTFAEAVRKRYKGVIIDEFQDTDPIQWNIFKTLFYDDPEKRASLYLVGDPKQSIYAFRGADLYTYLSASEAIGDSHRATLDTNYRSQPALVHALNTLFSEKRIPSFIGLPNHESTLPYQPVKAGKNETELPADERGSIHFFIAQSKKGRSKSWPSQEVEQHYLFPFIRQEISRLRTKIPLKEQAILVRDRYQADRLAKFLSQSNIPATLRRSETLASSEAMQEMRFFLQALINPKNQAAIKAALGGKLIGWDDDLMKTFVDAWGHEPFYCEETIAKFYELRKILIEDDIASCFQAFMQTSWHIDGLSVEERTLSRERGVELHTDCYHLTELLMEYQQQTKGGIDTLLEFFDQVNSWVVDEEERVISRRAHDRDAVQILTLHMSKGLEFEVVFALGLANRSQDKNNLFNLSKEGMIERRYLEEGDIDYFRACEEIDAEKMRLLYVAMTRAKKRVYVPLLLLESTASMDIGEASPMELFLGRMIHPSLAHTDLYQQPSSPPLEQVEGLLKSLQEDASITYSFTEATVSPGPAVRSDETTILFPPKAPIIPGEPQYLYSYSSLMRHAKEKIIEPLGSLGAEGAPHLLQVTDKNVHTLPAGNETGNILHALLEKLSFEKAALINSAYEMVPFLEKAEDLPDSFSEWKKVFAEMLYNAVKTPLKSGDDAFCLAEVSDRHCYREMEFLYSRDANSYLKGFIDLVFWHRDKYYILDWKSNYLGSSINAYSQDNLNKAMHEHNYYLQADLYSQALRRYLKQIDTRSFDELFGGVFYLFLRGLSPEQGPHYGVFHFLRG